MFGTDSILSWQVIKDGYVLLISGYVPGPLSLSYFVPFVLLPLAMMIPPSCLSHRQLYNTFLPPIFASVFHSWYAMGGVDVISVDGLLWSLFLIGLKDVRKDFRRLSVRVDSYKVPCKDEYRTGPMHDETPSVKNIDTTDSSSNEETETRVTQNCVRPSTPKDQHPIKAQDTQILEQAYPEDITARANWVFTLLASTRMYAWVMGSPAHDQRQFSHLRRKPQRCSFVLSLLPTILFTQMILLPIIIQLVLHDPTITALTAQADPPNYLFQRLPLISPSAEQPVPRTVSFLQTYVPHAVLSPLTHGFWAFSALTTGFALPAPFVVISNYLVNTPSISWSPHVLPPYFGPISTVLDHGAAGLWGRWWHQHMRIMVSAPGLAVADSVGLTEERVTQEAHQGTMILKNARYVLQVISGFFFSGITHMGLVPPLACGAWGLRLRIAAFFWLQGLAIIFERFAGLVWEAYGLRLNESKLVVTSMARILRLTWVLTWLCLTLPLLARPFDQLGWWKLWPPPALPSKVLWFMRGEWIP